MRNSLGIEIRDVASTIRRDHETLDTAPAHANSESLQLIDESPHLIELTVHQLEAEQSGMTGQRIRRFAERWMTNLFHLGPSPQVFSDA